ncbi:MAG: DNA translocase FtsK 4TM domain-containing protein [Candidatus Omnitrophica bacterium]|nr:DNA translocase FtsK 4TM domain-containing protein [Candidatus Omnitrophota bacterium]
MKEKRVSEIKGIIIMALGLIILASLVSFSWYDLSLFSFYPNRPLHNWIKSLGSIIGACLFFVFGWSAYLVCFFLFWLAYRLFIYRPYELRFIKIVGIFIIFVSLSSLLSLMGNQTSTFRFKRAGILGMVLADLGSNYLGNLGSYIVFITFFILALSLATGELISTFILGFFDKILF